jgi:hypothetical protein
MNEAGAAFRIYGSAVPAPKEIFSAQHCQRHTGTLRKRHNLLKEVGVGEEPKHTTARKPGPNYSKLCDLKEKACSRIVKKM